MVEFRFGVSFVMCFDAVATRLFTPPPYPSPASLHYCPEYFFWMKFFLKQYDLYRFPRNNAPYHTSKSCF